PGAPELETLGRVREPGQLPAVRVHDVEVVVIRAVVPHERDVVAVRREARLDVCTGGRERHLVQALAVELHRVDRPGRADSTVAGEGDRAALRRGRRRDRRTGPGLQLVRARAVGADDPRAVVVLV